MTRAARYTAVLIALCAAGSLVLAQEGGRSRRGAGPGADDTARGARERNSLIEELGAHLLDVQQRLKLETGQQAAWDAFAARVQALMQDQLRGPPAASEHEDAPHAISRRVDLVRNRLAAMEDIADAANHLYSVLTDPQRKLADELLPTAVPSLYSGLPDTGRSGSQLSRERESR